MEAIFGVVGDPDRVFFGVVGDDTEDGTENLFLGNRHIVLDVDEHRGLDVVARLEAFGMPLAAGQHFGTFFNALADVGLNSLVLFLRDHRPDGGLRVSRIADGKRAHRLP